MYYSKTPLEAKLEREVEQLKAKIEYLEGPMPGSGSHSAMYEPKEIVVAKLAPTVTIRQQVAFGWKDSLPHHGFHVFARERFADGMAAGYFLDYQLSEYPRADRARILQDCMEKATRELQEYLSAKIHDNPT